MTFTNITVLKKKICVKKLQKPFLSGFVWLEFVMVPRDGWNVFIVDRNWADIRLGSITYAFIHNDFNMMSNALCNCCR